MTFSFHPKADEEFVEAVAYYWKHRVRTGKKKP